MAKIAFIGAGSLGFTRRLVVDMLLREELADATLSLIDIDPERLGSAEAAVQKIVDTGKFPVFEFDERTVRCTYSGMETSPFRAAPGASCCWCRASVVLAENRKRPMEGRSVLRSWMGLGLLVG